jgi:cytochrome P450
MPVIESVIRETLRILGSGTPLRRNLADDLRVAGKTIDKGAFMVYNSADVHLNERFYPEPLKFDPDRFNLIGEDDTQGKAPFLAWGTGRHPCAGEFPHRSDRIRSKCAFRYESCEIGDQNNSRPFSVPL